MQHLRNLSGWGCAKSSQSPQIFSYRDRMSALRGRNAPLLQCLNCLPDVVAALDSQRRMHHIENAAQIGDLCPKCVALCVQSIDRLGICFCPRPERCAVLDHLGFVVICLFVKPSNKSLDDLRNA